MAKGRSVHSRADEGGPSSNQGATFPHDQTAVPTQKTTPSSRPAPTTQPQNEVVSQPFHTLRAIHEATKRITGDQTTQSPVSTLAPSVVEPVIDEPVQGLRQQTLTTCQLPGVEAMFKKERDQEI